ncbi:hemoglobin [Nitrosospira sp. Nsp14]|uniref:group II truncated hemoglobin n=1 Tax=Nitrosospira sp. Nsp14 TaxID=1855333 RepID=UPI0008E4C01A|nr:group II truncated hemoglobin [Nitrosospira sp. Nsp14]SFH30457.1 hemoglobin [Nitrosospira sp. Nsp14]
MHLIEAYELMGGETAVRCLVDRFYDLMDEDPDYYGIRKLHPQDLSNSRQKLFMFLCGFMGGPSLYTEKFGEPRMRTRHLPFSIGVSERDQWLSCMSRAMEDVGLEQEVCRSLGKAFYQTADFMRNQPE